MNLVGLFYFFFQIMDLNFVLRSKTKVYSILKVSPHNSSSEGENDLINIINLKKIFSFNCIFRKKIVYL